MNRITKKVRSMIGTIPKLYETDGETDKKAFLHFFNPLGRGDWYVTEMKELKDKDFLFFGYVVSPLGSDCDEWGYFTLSEILNTRILELDKSFEPQLIKELI